MASRSASPATPAEILDDEWLTEHVYPSHSDVRVTSHELVERLGTTATKLRLKLSLDNTGNSVPTDVCIKAMLDEFAVNRGIGSVSIVEAKFYAEVASPLAEVGVLTPPCVATGIDESVGRGLIIMEDLIVAGARFLSALTPYSSDEARQSLDQLARMHAASWELPAPYNLAWIDRRLDAIANSSMVPLDVLQGLMDGPRSAPLPEGIANAKRLHAALGKLSARFSERPGCLVHGDAHAGNLYEIDGRIGVIDWQLLQVGCWAQDVAYHMAAALLPEDRKAHEHELLAHYLDRLKAHGGPELDPAVAWDDYRAAMLYGYYLWAITKRVDPVIINEFNRRLGLAIAELGSYELVE